MSSVIDCSICVVYLQDAKHVAAKEYFVTTECGHVFHYTCLTQHYNDKGARKCPLCQKSMDLKMWRKLSGNENETLDNVNVNEIVSSNENKFKLILLGNSGVGKTCLAQTYMGEEFYGAQSYTTGIDWFSKPLELGTQRVNLGIYDTAGLERFRAILASYYREAQGAMLVYDVTNISSFNAVTSWINELSSLAPECSARILVGTKADLKESRQVNEEDGENLAAEFGIPFIETSAKEFYNVENAFELLVTRIFKDLAKSPNIPRRGRGSSVFKLDKTLTQFRNRWRC